MFFGSTMVMVTVALVMAVIVTNIYAKKDSAQQCPRWAIKLARKLFPEVIIPPEEKPRLIMGHKRDCNGRQSDVMSITDGEMDSLTCGCCCHCRTRADHGQTQLDIDRIDAEWRLVSKFADRCFFWLFVILSTSVQCVLFMHMVPEGPHPSTQETEGGGG